MTEEEMRAKILELEKSNETLTTERDTYKSLSETRETELSKKDEQITKLKETNLDFFTQLTSKVETQKTETKTNNESTDITLNDIVRNI